MPSRTIKPADKHDPETCKALAAKLVAARREAIAKKATKDRWQGEWWDKDRKPTG